MGISHPFPAQANARRFSRVTNAYGLLRAPWNADPTPFMTRSAHVYGYPNNMKPSGCAEFASALRSRNWNSFSQKLNSAAHGHIHEALGGSWDHDLGAPGTPAVLLFAHSVQALSKDLWRAGVLACASDCDVAATPARDCRCACDPAATRNATPRDVLRDAGVLRSLAYYDADGAAMKTVARDDDESGERVGFARDVYSRDDAAKAYHGALAALCDPGHIGDMFQASSTNDPAFWVLHGNIDRIWHLKRLVAKDRAGYDEAWAPDHACYGHNPDDLQPWRRGSLTPGAANAKRRDRAAATTPTPTTPTDAAAFYTNAQLYDLFRPDDAFLGYLYDDFHWPHCDLMGVSLLKAALKGLSQEGAEDDDDDADDD